MVVNKKSGRNAASKTNSPKAVSNNKEIPSVTHPKLIPLLITKPERLAAYKKRRDQYLYESISPSDTEKYETAGWILHKESKTRVRMKRLKQHNQTLDDQVWCLLYRMGYPELSGEGFRIGYTNIDGSASEKKINVFAKDDETVVIVECKSKETRGRKNLSKDILDTTALQKPISIAIKKHYGNNFKPKIIWAYVTNNIIWSESDLEQASAANIRIITDLAPVIRIS